MLLHVIQPCKWVFAEWAYAADRFVVLKFGQLAVVHPNVPFDLLLTSLDLGTFRSWTDILVGMSSHVLSCDFVSFYEIFVQD